MPSRSFDAKVFGDEVGAEDGDDGKSLSGKRLDGREEREPGSDPAGNHERQVVGREPAGKLELLGALADHDHQDEAEHDTRPDQHPFVRQLGVDGEGGDSDRDGEQQAQPDPRKDDPRASAQAQALQEEYDLEALPVDGGEAEQGEAEHHLPAGVEAARAAAGGGLVWWAIQPVQ